MFFFEKHEVFMYGNYPKNVLFVGVISDFLHN